MEDKSENSSDWKGEKKKRKREREECFGVHK